MLPDTVLEGRRLRLRPLAEQDLPLLRQWDQDAALARLVGRKFGPDRTPRSWLQDLGRSPHRVGLAVETRDEGLLGDLELEDINWRNGSAELRICLGRKNCWGKGFGSEAVSLAIDYAFKVLGLRTLYLRVELNNWRAIRCYQKCGFVPEGVLRAGRRRRDGHRDLVLMVHSRYNKANPA